jgi:hypothetical protein
MRLNFELNEAQMASINALKARTGASSMKELFNNALSILDWAVDEIAQGREIAAVSPDSKNYRVFVTPLLRQVQPQPAAHSNP